MKIVVVTGGTSGLGRELSLAFARTDFFCIALYKSDESAAAELETIFSKQGLQGKTLKFIVGDTNPDVLVEKFPQLLDVSNEILLINNAGCKFYPQPMHLISPEIFLEMHKVFVSGPAALMQYFLPQMVRNKKSGIINILTGLLSTANHPPRGYSAYLANKSALATLTAACGQEYSHKGVRIFSASPGFMRTALTTQAGMSGKPPKDENFSVEEISPQTAAEKIHALYLDSTILGCGENYFI